VVRKTYGNNQIGQKSSPPEFKEKNKKSCKKKKIKSPAQKGEAFDFGKKDGRSKKAYAPGLQSSGQSGKNQPDQKKYRLKDKIKNNRSYL